MTALGKIYSRGSNGEAYRYQGNITQVRVDHPIATETLENEDVVNIGINGIPKTAIFVCHSFSGNNGELDSASPIAALLAMPDVLVACANRFGPAGAPNTCGAPAELTRMKSTIDILNDRYGFANILMTGVSGGAGFGPQFMGAYPGLIKGASFWCGYHDFAAWYAESVSAGHIYNSLMDSAFGGGPSALAAKYLAQSPKGTLNNAKDCIIYINDGRLDVEIPPHHRTDMRDQLLALPPSANVDCRYIAYPSMGHAVDYGIAVTQLTGILSEIS